MIYKIEDISIKQYFELEDNSQYDMFVNTLNPINEFKGRKADLTKLTFDEIEIIKKILSKSTIDNIKDLFISVYNLKGNMSISSSLEFFETSIFDLFRAQKYIQEFISKLINNEIKLLTCTPDEKMVMINALERLKPVNHLLSKIRLAEQFSTTPNIIGAWKYNDVFPILIANHLNSEVKNDYWNLK